jgi:hypothetical protein
MGRMCRNIRTLFNFDPPATEEEIRAASVQFVRKLSGFSKPSQANEAAFDLAIERGDCRGAPVDRLARDVDRAARSCGVGSTRQAPRRSTLQAGGAGVCVAVNASASGLARRALRSPGMR